MSSILDGEVRRLGEDSFHALCRGWRMRAKDRLVHPLTFRYWSECIGVDRMTRAELLALQDRRLADLLSHTIRHVPFYRR